MSVFIKSSTFANVNHKQHYKRNNMIDDKKIEEAAKSLRKDFNDDVTQGFLVEFGFEKGAKWAIDEFLKDLWHDESEKPIMSEHGMIIVELNDITACKYSLWRSTTTYETLCNNKGYIRRWLYLNDLLPKEGDNHD